MGKLKSSIPGMPYPSGRNYFFKTSYNFLEGRRADDRAEGLWRIHDNLYDLEKFIKYHPGGSEWLEWTRGTDITEAFESHHITDKAERLLPKYFVRKAAEPRILPYIFAPDGFYRKLKERVREVLKGVDYHNAAPQSKLIADFLASMTIFNAVLAVTYKSFIAAGVCAIFLAWTAVAGHNFFHLRNNFRMYYFDLSLLSSKEWRISHVLSHHLYPNTIWDMEIYMLEPFISYLPSPSKSFIHKIFMIVANPVVLILSIFNQGIRRYYSLYKEWKKVEFRDIVPFILPTVMFFFASSFFEAIKFWLCILALCSLFFHFIGLNAAHHHPDIFHDGDICRENLDWGLMELDAVRDRKIIDDSLFLVLTNFGSHGLHHMFPSIDHAYLDRCLPAFRETCKEFNVDCDKLTQWQLIKGQYQQIIRSKLKCNMRKISNSLDTRRID